MRRNSRSAAGTKIGMAAVQMGRGWGNPSIGMVCVGGRGLYSAPASSGVRSDWLVSFGAVRLGPVGSFGSVLSEHLRSAYV
jgi:hypothetical protein